MTFARIVPGVDAVATAKAQDLLTSALCRRFRMPAGLMGADEVVFALRANPLVSDVVVLETFEIGPGGSDVRRVDQGGENGESRRREVRVIRSGCIGNAQVGQVGR